VCGVFGFVGREGGRPDLRILQQVARATEKRGHHAFGFAWVDSKGRLHAYRQTGRVSEHLAYLRMAQDAELLIGHCRYATQGSPALNANNHPHPADGGWLVHNGMLPEYHRIVERHDLYPVSECDSEVLGLLIEQAEGTLLDRCRTAVRKAAPVMPAGGLFDRVQPLVMLGLWARPGRLVVVRRGNPLHLGRTAEGIYLASLPDELPGDVAPVRDNTARVFTKKGVHCGAL